MTIGETEIFPAGTRDTIDQLRHELEAQPILGIKKRLVFATNLIREAGLPEEKGYYLIIHESGRWPTRASKGEDDQQKQQSDPGMSSNIPQVRWIRLLTQKREYLIGRNPDSSDITLHDPYISKTHCRLIYESKTWKIMDINSMNGVRVNYNLTEEKYLRSADLIGLSSNTTLIFINTSLFERPPINQ